MDIIGIIVYTTLGIAICKSMMLLEYVVVTGG
mgnify:CR=1 FL=1